jgi:hypothetical protein
MTTETLERKMPRRKSQDGEKPAKSAVPQIKLAPDLHQMLKIISSVEKLDMAIILDQLCRAGAEARYEKALASLRRRGNG